MVLSVAVVAIWQYLFPPPQVRRQPVPSTSAAAPAGNTASQPGAETPVAPAPGAGGGASGGSSAAAAAPAPAPPAAAAVEPRPPIAAAPAAPRALQRAHPAPL